MAQLDVLIPHYNDLSGLQMSVQSLRAQDWTGEMRIVVCDDGSRQEVYEQIEGLLSSTRLPYYVVRHRTNMGRPYARNTLLDAVESKYVAWLDAGDVWYPQKVAAQFDQLFKLEFAGTDTTSTWITCNYDWKWENQDPRSIAQKTDGDQVKSLLIGSTLRAYLWTLLGRAESFRKVGYFDEELPRVQDLDYFLRFVQAGGRISNTANKEALCRYNKSDVGRNASEVLNCFVRIHNKHAPYIEQYGHQFKRMRYYNALMHAARFAENNQSRWQKYSLMARAAKVRPLGFLQHVTKRGLSL